MPVSEPAALRDLLALHVSEAADIALDFFRKGARNWTKSNNSPVSEADLAVDQFLRQRLVAARPDFGWLSEETADTADRLSCRDVFIIDPIDGTRAFVSGLPDWTISAAIVRDGRPIAAVLAEPVAGHMFSAAAGEGVERGGQRLSIVEPTEGGIAAGPKFMVDPLERLGLTSIPKVHSLALRLARVAAGEFAVGLASRNCHDWDIAAADLLVQEAGGVLADFRGQAPTYNRRTTTHPALAAASPDLHQRVSRVLG